MRVHYDEGVATHIGPEPCVGTREGAGEASVGECIGQPLSREIRVNPGADTVLLVEGHMAGFCWWKATWPGALSPAPG